MIIANVINFRASLCFRKLTYGTIFQPLLHMSTSGISAVNVTIIATGGVTVKLNVFWGSGWGQTESWWSGWKETESEGINGIRRTRIGLD